MYKYKKIREATRMVLDENDYPLDCETIKNIINDNLDHYHRVKKIKGSKSIKDAVNRKDCTDLEMKEGLVYIVGSLDRNENFNGYNRSNIKISITENLKNDLEHGDKKQFCNGIQNITQLLEEWYSDQFVTIILGHSIRELKVILGTREEVIELRKAFKGIDSSELDLLKLKIINCMSSKKACQNIHKLKELHRDFEVGCKNNGRYAYYVPIKCGDKIQVYPVSNISNQISNYKCDIHKEVQSWYPDYIMMPYGVDENSKIVFTPQFYQALYHELYHYLVINKYRCSKTINEGSPELYSEICYDQFLKYFIDSKLINGIENKKFHSEYMRFRYNGGYKPYYDYVKNKMLYSPKLDIRESIPYDMFCEFVLYLIRKRDNNKHNCKDKTPQCDPIFKKAIEHVFQTS